MPAGPCASALLRCGARGTALGPWRRLAVSWRDRAECVESRRRGVEPARADALQLDFAAIRFLETAARHGDVDGVLLARVAHVGGSHKRDSLRLDALVHEDLEHPPLEVLPEIGQ